MRNIGSKTLKNCWKLQVVNQNNIIFENEYKTLKEVALECGKSYNQIVELSSGRKKQPSGRFDTQYNLIKMSGKLNSVADEVIESEEEEEQSVEGAE